MPLCVNAKKSKLINWVYERGLGGVCATIKEDERKDFLTILILSNTYTNCRINY